MGVGQQRKGTSIKLNKKMGRDNIKAKEKKKERKMMEEKMNAG